MGIIFSNPIFEVADKAVANDRPMELHESLPMPTEETAMECTAHFKAVWEEECRQHSKSPSLWKAALKAYKGLVIAGFLLRLLYEGCNVGLAFTLRGLVLWFKEENPAPWEGYFLCAWLFVINMIGLWSFTMEQEYTQLAFQKLRSALTVMIFRKTMKLHSDHQQQGRIVQMHSSDTGKLKEMPFVQALPVGPIAIVGYIIALWFLLGPAALLSVVILGVAVPLQSKASTLMGANMAEMQRVGDFRIKAINELVQGIRICKFMGWEEPFHQKIQKLRAEEIGYFFWVVFYRSVIVALTYMIPNAMQVAVFGVAWGTGTPITAERIFPALALMQTMRGTVIGFSIAVGKFVELWVSLGRIGTFMFMEEKENYLKILPPHSSSSSSIVKQASTLPPSVSWREPFSAESPLGNPTSKGDNVQAAAKKETNPSHGGEDSENVVVVLRNSTFGYLESTAAEGTKSSKRSTKNAQKKDEADSNQQETSGGSGEKTTNKNEEPSSSSSKFTPLLSKINLSFTKGSLSIVIGHTGAGKSTLLNGIIGEARQKQPKRQSSEENAQREKKEGEEDDDDGGFVACQSSVAFVSQEPWIQNASIRTNILLDQPYNDERYLQAVQACQLASDFAALADGDMTEIGERGINISGGQKQRIAFARAVYSGREIVVMDDPLSAVDSHVGAALFEDCIIGALHGRTRILVTHHVIFSSP